MARRPEEILEQARKLIDAETELFPDRYPIEYDPIRRFCHMSDDTNPLFLDPEYAHQTKHGEVLCPPLMITRPGYGGNGAWPPSERTRVS
jgi:acyl dehydratase